MRKTALVLIVICVALSVFGAAASTGLTDDEVKSFIKNFDNIYAELDKLGVNVKDYNDLVVSSKVLNEAEKILNKYGVSGKNSVDKVKAIVYGYAVEYYDSELAKNKETADMVKKLGFDPMSGIRPLVSDEDKSIVKKYLSELTKTFSNYVDMDASDAVTAQTQGGEENTSAGHGNVDYSKALSE